MTIWAGGKSRLHMGGTSDHALLIVELRKLQSQTKPFSFTNSWLKRPGMKEVVIEAWKREVRRSTPILEFTWRLRNTKKAIKNWVGRVARTDEELKEALKILEVRKRDLLQNPMDMEKKS